MTSGTVGVAYSYEIAYSCPECRGRNHTTLPFIVNNLKVRLEKGRWCSYCEARHNLKYKIRRKRTGETVFIVTKFMCNDKPYRRNGFRRTGS